MSYLRGAANQPVYFQMVETTSGFGGPYTNPCTVYVEKDNGGQVVGSVAAGATVHRGNGSHVYVPAAAEFDADIVKFTCIPNVALAAVNAGVEIATLSAVQQQAIQLATGGQYRAMDAIITAALIKIRAARSGDAPPAEDLQLGLDTLNRLYDAWNAEDRAAWTVDFTDFTFTPNLSPHTIGPTGTFVVTQRPTAVVYAYVNLGGAPAVYVPIAVREKGWYASQPLPSMTNSFPTDCYYSPDFPNGNLYFWGVPSTAYGVRLWLPVVLNSVVLTDTFLMPPGYEQAVLLTLAETLAEDFGRAVTPTLERQAREARALIFGKNEPTPYLSTADAGIPRSGGGARASSFNYRSRSFN